MLAWRGLAESRCSRQPAIGLGKVRSDYYSSVGTAGGCWTSVSGTLAAWITGSLITQRASDRRETVAWVRERERERELWAREDEARTFEHRRQSFVEFYEAVKALARTYNHCYGFTDGPELPEGWQSDAYAKLAQLEFYADRNVAAAASAAYGAAWSWGHFGEYDAPENPDFHERQQKYEEAELEMLLLVRRSLSIPEADSALPPPGYTYESDPAAEEGAAESEQPRAAPAPRCPTPRRSSWHRRRTRRLPRCGGDVPQGHPAGAC